MGLKIKIFHIIQNRYLTEEELQFKYFYTGIFDKVEEFDINLVNCKVQTILFTDTCESDIEEYIFEDNDDFRMEIIND